MDSGGRTRGSVGGRPVLVTGALGCIGAWVVRQLLADGDRPIAFDLGRDRHRLEWLLTDEQLADVTFVEGDITSREVLDDTIERYAVEGLIHLAGLQVPSCAANPALGALVNVVGTVNVFESVKLHRDRVGQLVFASTAGGLYDESDAPNAEELPEDALGHPRTHYGVYKQANEGTARVYWHQDRLPSVGIRPAVVFGVGRDQGMTASPTRAMLAAALGRRYEITYSSASQMPYARDVAAAFVGALAAGASGSHVYNIGGPTIAMDQVVRAIEEVAPEAKDLITVADRHMGFPGTFASSIRDALRLPPPTPFADAVRETVEAFRDLAVAGKVGPEGLM
jgi:UDP-glucuronate 4-epimerase